ncbi:MAG: methyltransferase [Gammaproteobacteria bacterium]|nr:methyltransferase [Gammaproteobacteria bacterium]
MSSPAPQAVRGALTFIVPQESKPYFESSALTGGDSKAYFETEAREVTIRDMRALPAASIDKEGFELVPHQSAVTDFYNDRSLKDVYEQELATLLTDRFGASRVAVFDHTRRSDAPEGAANPDGPRGPATRVHVDYTVVSGPKRAADALGQEEVTRILDGGGRIMQVNVWRPIVGPVRRTPLALADASSIAASELTATDQIFPDRIGEIYQIAYGPDQKWYWVPNMDRDEVLLIKGWDSLDDGRAMFTPHGAFELPNQSPDAPARQSIEVRTYVIFE